MWSLTLPQVAATLTGALVAFRTVDRLHQRIDHRMLNAVFVLMVTTGIIGPILTQQFAPLMREEENQTNSARSITQTVPAHAKKAWDTNE
jgi:hypothetical protein